MLFSKKQKNKLDDRYWITFSIDDNEKLYVDVGCRREQIEATGALLAALVSGALNPVIVECLLTMPEEEAQVLLQRLQNKNRFLNPLDM